VILISLSEFREAFALFDRDNSGEITVIEMGTVMRALGQNPSQSDLYEMIGRIDRDSKCPLLPRVSPFD
jgi:Ca2+-binding EF-hand superfamily protein